MPEPRPRLSHAGWLRTPGQPWRQVCQAVSEDACWRLLFEHETEARRVDRVVLRLGQHPEDRR